MTERSIVIEEAGEVLTTALVCPGYAFDQFGTGGPTFSPDQHWVLVDVLGPYTPGNVPRTHVLVHVAGGAIVFGPDFPRELGVPASTDRLMWATGERAALRYADGTTRTLAEPRHPLPKTRCLGVRAAKRDKRRDFG